MLRRLCILLRCAEQHNPNTLLTLTRSTTCSGAYTSTQPRKTCVEEYPAANAREPDEWP
jgi:hypothetical protein